MRSVIAHETRINIITLVGRGLECSDRGLIEEARSLWNDNHMRIPFEDAEALESLILGAETIFSNL